MMEEEGIEITEVDEDDLPEGELDEGTVDLGGEE